MKILGIDTSCDETSAAVLDGRNILSNIVSSQIKIHAEYGGVVPELASRAHIENIRPVVHRALAEAGLNDFNGLDAVAVTAGPGLVGALLVGINYAKAAAWKHDLPLVPVQHIQGHLESVFLAHGNIPLPGLSLVVSGGHTSLYQVDDGEVEQGPHRYTRLGTTRDDAVGEAFDKVAKAMGLPYPGGPVIERLAKLGDPEFLKLPSRPKIDQYRSLDFSYSGLKSAVARYIESRSEFHSTEFETNPELPEKTVQLIRDIAASFQYAAVDELLWIAGRTLKAHPAKSLSVSGGVSVNQYLRNAFLKWGDEKGIPVFFPPPELTTDNGAMIAYAGMLEYPKRPKNFLTLNAQPGWKLC